MKLVFTFAVLALVMQASFAQQTTPTDSPKVLGPLMPTANKQFGKEPPKIYEFVEKMPAPPYDIDAYLQQNIKYPEQALNKNVQGKVVVQFMVREDGSITDLKILRSVGAGCDEEALRVIRQMPKWKPAMSKGKPVKTLMTKPIDFALK